MLLAGVAALAAVGAVCRYLLDLAVERRHDQIFPWGTFVINVSGSFLLGIVVGLALHHGLGSTPVTLLGTGLLGGYTTWSTYLWETLALADTGAFAAAALNAIGSLAVGLAAAAAGLGIVLL